MSAQPPYGPPTTPPPGYGPPRSPYRAALISAAVVGLVIIAGVAYWLGGRHSSPSADPVLPPVTTTSALPSAAGSPSSGPSASPAPSASASAPVTQTSAAAAVTSAAPTTTPPAHPVPDFGYVTGVATVGGVPRLTFDRAILLTGDAAAKAAKAHGQELDDDYFIVNDNPLLRTFTVSPTVTVTGSINLSGQVASQQSSLPLLEGWISAHPGQHLPVDLSYDGAGQVTKIAEVYFP